MAKVYEDYCNRVCGHLKLSERRCFRNECHLKNFFDELLLKIPKDTMLTLSDTIRALQLENDLRNTRYGSLIKQVNLQGSALAIHFDDSVLSDEDKIKLNFVNPDEVLIISAYRILVTNLQINEFKLSCALKNLPDVNLVTTRSRLIELISHEGMIEIKKDWNAIWNYFRPVLNNPEFAVKVRDFLNGYSNDNPIEVQNQQSPGWLNKFLR